MTKFLKILKINLLSLAAIPLLLLATVFKLIAKSLEKIPLLIGLLIAAGFVMSMASFSTSMENIATIIAVIVVGCALFGVLIALLIWVFSLISSLVVLVYSLIVSAFDGLYHLCYTGYLSLFASCEADYQLISLSGKGAANAFLCLFFSILRALGWLITTVISLSLPAAILCSLGLIAGSLYSLNRNMQTVFGLNLIQFAQKSRPASVIGGVFLYVAAMAICITALLAFALEWYEWAQDLKMSGLEISEEISALQNRDIKMESGASQNWLDSNQKYLDALEDHMERIEPLGNQVQEILSKKDSALLRSNWGVYIRNLNSLAEECSSKKGITPEQFRKLIPQIQQLDKQREDVRKMADKLMQELQNPAGSTVFFAGCDTPEKLEKRYKSLCKAYHPDMGGGDTATFQKMKDEYETLKSGYGEEE